MCCGCCSVRQQKIWVFTLGSIFFLLGIVLISAWPSIYRQVVKNSLPLSPGSFMYRNWVTTPVTIYTSFYLFNWTNPEDLNNPNVKPHYEQLGPYTYSDYKVKLDLLWEDPLVTFYGRRTFHFLPEHSNGSLDDVIVTPHFPSWTAAYYFQRYRRPLRKIINFVLNEEGGRITMVNTARNWIFDGFYDSILDFAERLHSPRLPFYSDSFAWFYIRNNSKLYEGNFTIHTGQGDLNQMGELHMWNGTRYTGNYEGECGKVNGSTGELWAPGRRYEDTISIFMSDAGRFINMYTVDNVTLHGIDAWRYETSNLTFDNGQLNPSAKCFCVANRKCPMNGVVDFAPSAYYGPFYLSHPHFYMTDDSYRENTTGLRPNKAEHGMYVIMEPTLGIPLVLKGQLMVSGMIKRDEQVDLFKNVAYDHYAPLMTLEMRSELDDNFISLLKFILNAAAIGQYIGLGLSIVGMIMILVGLILTSQHKWYNEGRVKPIEIVRVLESESSTTNNEL